MPRVSPDFPRWRPRGRSVYARAGAPAPTASFLALPAPSFSLTVRAIPQPQSPESIHRCCDIDEAWAGKVPRQRMRTELGNNVQALRIHRTLKAS